MVGPVTGRTAPRNRPPPTMIGRTRQSVIDGGWGRMDVQARRPAIVGLTTAEADARRRRGEANAAVSGTSRTYATDPAHQRLLLLQHHPVRHRRRAAGAGPLQRRADQRRARPAQRGDQRRAGDPGQAQARPAAAARPGARARRPGRPGGRASRRRRSCAATSLRVRPGDQIVVDGPVLDGRVEVDESLLTGESDPVVKEPGDELLSGSLCVGGRRPPARPRRRARRATPAGSPPRRAGSRPTPPRCSGGSRSSSGW